MPTATINPLTVADQGGLDMLGQTGEYLTFSNQHLTLQPALAESWTPNSTADVWTFKIRQGVKFHNGQPLTADDVVYTYKLQTDPKSSANALSAFGGGLTPDGVVKVDDFTVAFHLTAPNGNFPYLTSSDNYNMIIIPNNYDPAKWQSSFVGTGPFVLKSYTPKVGASFTRNAQYWGPKAAARRDRVHLLRHPDAPDPRPHRRDHRRRRAVRRRGRRAVARPWSPVQRSSTSSRARTGELSMRNDQAPFTDPRVRQAIALTLDRPAIVEALFKGNAAIGNDSPFAPVFPSTNQAWPSAREDIAKAKSLLSAAGHSSGFTAHLVTEQFVEIPQYAQIVVQAAKQIGVTIKLTVESSSAYYGKATFGNSDWLDAQMSLVDYGHRSVPNVFLTAPLQTTNAKKGTGSWNAAHFSNSQYDKLSNQYIATSDLTTQRTIAGQIETLLLNETPIIFGYFYNYLSATAKNVTGAYPTAIGHIFLNKATKS